MRQEQSKLLRNESSGEEDARSYEHSSIAIESDEDINGSYRRPSISKISKNTVSQFRYYSFGEKQKSVNLRYAVYCLSLIHI